MADTSSNNKFCTVIQSEIRVKRCPLKSGSCVWQHRETRECKFSKSFVNSEPPPTPQQIANLVGETRPMTERRVEAIKERIIQAFRKSIQE